MCDPLSENPTSLHSALEILILPLKYMHGVKYMYYKNTCFDKQQNNNKIVITNISLFMESTNICFVSVL